jgi:hypothetical protein
MHSSRLGANAARKLFAHYFGRIATIDMNGAGSKAAPRSLLFRTAVGFGACRFTKCSKNAVWKPNLAVSTQTSCPYPDSFL